MALTLRPVTLRQANEIVETLHRHHKPARGCKFCVAAVTENGDICGALVAGRPVARGWDQTYTLEVNRVATDGTKNACSILYGSAARAAKALGYHRIITYVLPEEGGASLRAAGWTFVGERGGGSWDTPTRRRGDHAPLQVKHLWEVVFEGNLPKGEQV